MAADLVQDFLYLNYLVKITSNIDKLNYQGDKFEVHCALDEIGNIHKEIVEWGVKREKELLALVENEE